MRNKRALNRALQSGNFVRVDRQTIYGNPFHIGPDGTRQEVLAKHRVWVLRQSEILQRLPELQGKILGCWCTPLACHATTLAELADAIRD